MARIDTVKQQWRGTVGELDALIESSGTDRRKLSRSNQAKWIDKISVWAKKETNSYQLSESLEKFSQRFLEDHTKAGRETLRHPLSEVIDQLLAGLLLTRDLVITHALAEIRETVVREKRRRGELDSDDVLSRLDSALRSESGEVLVAAIRM